MAEDTAREDLNFIVQAIGFGIVSDFRELREAMAGVTYQTEESNRILGDVNQNLESTNRSIDQLEKDVYRQIDSRQFRQLENQIEGKNRQTQRKSDDLMRSVLGVVNDIKRQVGGVRMSAGSEDGGGSGGGPPTSPPPYGGATPPGSSSLPVVGGTSNLPAVQGSSDVDSFLQQVAENPLKAAETAVVKPIADVAVGAAGLAATAATAGLATSLISTRDPDAWKKKPPSAPQLSTVNTPGPVPPPPSSGGSPGGMPSAPPSAGGSSGSMPPPPSNPSSQASVQPSAPPASTNLAPSAPAGSTGLTQEAKGAESVNSNVNLSTVAQNVSGVTSSVKNKAVAKVQTKAANWFSQNGGRIVATIGESQTSTFGKLIGGRFSFSRFMSDDSWTDVGKSYVMGKPLPTIQEADVNVAYVSQVVLNLSIQAYLIAREIYTYENAAEIRSGLVPNFDDLDSYERKQAVKNVGASLENYVNFLIDRSRSQRDAAGQGTTASPAPDSTGTGAGLAPVAGGGAPGASMGGAAGGGGGGYSGGGPTGSPPSSGQGGGPSGSAPGSSQPGGGSSQGSAPPGMPSPTGPGPQAPASPPTGGNQGVTPSLTTSSGATTPRTSTGGDASVAPGEGPSALTSGTNKVANAGNFESMVATYGPRLMQDYGLTAEQAAAVLGNLGHESVGMTAGIQEKNPTAGRGGLGWAQWTGSRRRDFEAYLKATGQSATDPEANYGFLKTELDGSHSNAIEALKNSENIDAGVAAFEHRFEVSADYDQKTGKILKPQNVQSRYNYAGRALGVINSLQDQDSTTQANTESTSNTTATFSNESIPQYAEGATVTPLPSDMASSNMSNQLAPSTSMEYSAQGFAEKEEASESSSTSMQAIDARAKPRSANPHDEAKNKIGFYQHLMDHHFGKLRDDMKQSQEEVTADEHQFDKVMDPLS